AASPKATKSGASTPDGGRRSPPGLSPVPGRAQAGGDRLGSGLVDEDAAQAVDALGVSDDLDVPVVVVTDGGPVPLEDSRAEVRRRVQSHLVAWIVERPADRAVGVDQEPRQVARG